MRFPAKKHGVSAEEQHTESHSLVDPPGPSKTLTKLGTMLRVHTSPGEPVLYDCVGNPYPQSETLMSGA